MPAPLKLFGLLPRPDYLNLPDHATRWRLPADHHPKKTSPRAAKVASYAIATSAEFANVITPAGSCPISFRESDRFGSLPASTIDEPSTVGRAHGFRTPPVLSTNNRHGHPQPHRQMIQGRPAFDVAPHVARPDGFGSKGNVGLFSHDCAHRPDLCRSRRPQNAAEAVAIEGRCREAINTARVIAARVGAVPTAKWSVSDSLPIVAEGSSTPFAAQHDGNFRPATAIP